MTINKFFLRYDVLIVLFIMAIGFYNLSSGLLLRQKTQAQLFYLGLKSAKAYISRDSMLNADRIVFILDSSYEIIFQIDSIKYETTQQCIYLTSEIPLDKYLKGNTYTSGYIILQRKTLLKLT